jgi:hypothetical protein
MRYIDGANKVTDAFGPGKHGFTAGDPTQGTPATVVTDTFLNDLMREIATPIEAWLGALNQAQVTQLRDAIDARITARIAASLPSFGPGDTVINDGGQLETAMPSKFPTLPYTVTPADRGYLLISTATGTITLPTDGSLGSGFHCAVRNSGAGTTLTLSAAGGNIDGVGSITLRAGEGFLLQPQAANWRSIGRTSVAAASETASGVVELATTAETQTGTDAARAVTPAGLKGALGYSKIFQSTPQAMVDGTLYTFAHGLGHIPVNVYVTFECVTAQAPWAVGQEIALDNTYASSAIRGGSWWADGTNVYVQLGYAMIAWSGGFAGAYLTPANWQLRVRAW